MTGNQSSIVIGNVDEQMQLRVYIALFRQVLLAAVAACSAAPRQFQGTFRGVRGEQTTPTASETLAFSFQTESSSFPLSEQSGCA